MFLKRNDIDMLSIDCGAIVKLRVSMKKTYHFKKFYKLLSLVSLLVMLVATVLNAYLGEPITIVLLVAIVIIFLQYRRHSNPYIEIENKRLTIRYTWVKSFEIEIDKIVHLESHAKQIVLHFDTGKRIGIYLGYLKHSDQERFLEELPTLLNDWTQHLTES